MSKVRLRSGLAALAVALMLALLELSSAGAAPATNAASAGPVTFAASGALIIPMDTDTSANHATFNQNQGMWKAYGLVFRLLQNGIPVHWAISESKTATTDVDFSAPVKDVRTGTSLGTWDYRGGPFIINAEDAAAARPIISAWWAANANQPNVHETTGSFSADINVTLRTAPRIANEAINAGISIAYYNAAGIPDLNGRPWSTTSPNILDQAEIAAGGLFTQGSVCLQRKFDVFVTPHNGGYSYSLTDPSNLGTKTYAQLDTFVQQGGGWTALCHSILSNENAIADLTLNGANTVKSLFRTSQPGGKPGGFLTQTGFRTIDNTGGTWTVNPEAAGLPTAQLVPPSVAPGLPGGSVQTWPSPGNPGAPTYWSQTERVAFFDTPTVDHDHIVSGTYHDGTGLGKLTYIGGHSFSTGLPYSGNADAPFLRAFYNSLFFNGSAVAHLDLTHSPDTFPQNGTGLVSASIVNTGGSVAENVGNVAVHLAPGFTYAGTTAGPAPDVSLDGRTLTWIGGLGDVAGGATAVSFNVAVDASASGTAGAKQFAQLHATYGDVFGEGFTADICRDITVSPTPAPALTKTPSSQGPVSTGSTVTWTLNYGNTGAASLLGATLEDRLPPGFTYVSSSSSPSLGAPTVIPATSGTIVRFNVGTLPAGTPPTRTVTITARAGPVTAGSGTPPQQTFTNNATLRGQDAGGNSFSEDASADVDVTALDITLGKTVDKTFLSPLPGTLTYTLTPRSDDNELLDNVRVIDPVPTGVTSPAAGQGGTVGPYQPLAAVPGVDPGPPALNTAISVSSNLVTQGESVTVTMNVQQTSGATVNNVSPSDITAGGIIGGPATCTGPNPGSANVASGGTGTNFTWSCTLDGLGEYVFSGGAADSTGTTSWPAASSASVLSTTGGGPNVVTWNLGSNTAAVGGSVITSGYTPGVYGLRGATQPTFQKYDVGTGSWSAKANTLANVAKGGALTADGAGTIYELTGNGQQGFNAYNIAGNSWTARANTGTNVGEGGALVYLPTGPTKYVYAFMGNGTRTFKRYDVAANTWALMTDAPAAVKKGGSLTTDGTSIYALQGGGQKGFWRYDVASNAWTVLTPIPDNVNWGGGLVRVGNFLYATIGGGKNKFYRYDLTAGTWTLRANTPANVADGGALTTDGTFIYAFQGKTTAFWRYDIAANRWTVLAKFTANTGQGGALVFDPGLNPQGRFSSLTASRSLTVTGDTVDVTFTLTSSTPVSDVVPGTLGVAATGGASCSTLTGPVLTSPDDDISGPDDSVVFKWACTVAAAANPGSLTFSNTASAGGTVTFASATPATSNSVIVSPPLTFTVNVPASGAPNPVVNAGLLAASGQTTSSPQVSTFTGSPTLTIAKTNSPGEGATVRPGDPITYSMTVENTGTGNATGVVVTDSVPANTSFASCSGGSSCNLSNGTVSWTLGTLAPGDKETVTFTVNASSSLAISDTPYTISNAGTVDSDQTNPVQSNTVTNQLEVKPEIVKTVSTGEAAPGDTLTYTLTVSNPGAPFTADVSDSVPAGTTFNAGSCSPGCSFAAGVVTWSGQSIPHSGATFSFTVTVNAGTGGSTVTNSGTLDPSSPNLPPIDSNTTDTEIGPVLGLVKTNSPTGAVQNGDQITYTLVAVNESNVTAQGVVVSDPLPPGTSFGTCTTPVGTCGQSSGVVTFNLGSLAANGSITVSFTVTVGTPPVGTLVITNQAEVSATNTPETAESNQVNNPLPFPSILLSKSADRTSFDSVGDVISYEYLVTNESTTSTLAGPVTVTDDKASVTCPPGDVAPLDSITCTATYTVTQADLNAGSVTNTATAHAGGTDSNPDQVRVDANQAPELTLQKTAAETSFDAVGDLLHYTFTVKNTGNVALAGPVTVTDDKAADETCPNVNTVGNLDASLDPGEAIACSATYAVTQADLDAGSVTNTATAHAAGTNSNQDQATVDAVQKPHLTLVKEATLDTTQAGPDDRADAGDVIDYTLTATNDGNVTLSAVAIDDQSLTLDCTPPQPATLAPGAKLICTGTRTLDQDDINAGHVDNSATADGTPPEGGTVSDTDTANVPLAPKPHLTLVKEATLDITNGNPDRVDAGDVINYTLTATNDGNVTLTAVADNDPTLTLNCAPPQPAVLDPGEMLVCTGTRVLTQADIDAGHAENTGAVQGTDPNDKTVTDEDHSDVPLAQEPHLTLVKEATLDMTQAGPPDRVDAGDVVNYTLTATNDGNVTLTAVLENDPTLTLNCVPPQPATLLPGQSLVCTGTRVLTQVDVNAGHAENTADVQGTDPNGNTISDDDHSDVPLGREPHLSLIKDAAQDTFNAAGDVLNYTYTVENTGNISLAGPVTVTDDKSTNESCPGVNSVGNHNAFLDPGETIVCTATYTVTQTDVNAGSVTNNATAHAGGTDSNSDQVIVPAVQGPELTLTKQALESSFDSAGDVLHYTFSVENTGNVSLAGPVSVTDDKATDESCPDLATVGNGDASLDPGETVVCTASYTVIQSDLDDGSVTNNATAHAAGTNSNADQVIVPASQTPHLTLVKEATLDTAGGDPTRRDAGDVVHYTLTATNDGNVTLDAVSITDDPPLPLNCAPAQPTSLAPGAKLVCTGTRTLDQADFDAGHVEDTGSVEGTDPGGRPVGDTDTVDVPLGQTPHLTLVKEATLDITNGDPSRVDAGDVVHYTLTATNDGNVTLDAVSITDDPPLPLNCAPAQPATLAPGQALVCTGTRTLDQGDVNAGHAEDTGSAEGTDPNGKPVGDTDNVDVPLGQEPHLTLVKEATLDTSSGDPNRVDAGDVINYTLTATNDGNVTLTAVAQNDPTLTLDCVPPQPAILDPGEVLVCTGTRVLTQDDINAGHADNLASVQGTDPNGKTTGDQDNVDVPLGQEPQLTLVKDATETSFDTVGDVLHYTFSVENTGNVSLAGPVTVTDDKATDESCPNVNTVGNNDAFLDPGEQIVCTASYAVTQADLNAGEVTNTATAHAAGTDSNEDLKTVSAINTPALSLVKAAAETSYNAVGDVLHYTFTVENTGNVSLAGPVTVTDNRTSDETCPDVDTVGNLDANLDPGEKLVCSATYTVSQDDLNAGSVTNLATAHAAGTNSNPDTETVNAIQSPKLTLTKEAAETSYNTVGDVLHYTFTVENTGNVSLAGPVSVTDDLATDESCPNVNTVGNNDAFLDPGETIACTASYTVTQADLDAGSVTNTATAHADSTDSNADDATVNASQGPHLTLVKEATLDTTQAGDPDRVDPGDVIDYTLTATNDGNVNLTGVQISDPTLTLTCVPPQPLTLAPGGQIVCTGTRTLTQSDINTGRVDNAATVAGTAPGNVPVGDTDNVTVPLAQEPHLTLTKEATLDQTQAGPPDRADPGDVINYTLTAVNDGNVPLTDVAISDSTLTLNCAPSQPAILDPGESLVCTGTRVLTQDDIDAGQAENTGIVEGTDPKDRTVGDTDHVNVPLAQEPHLTLVKEATLDKTQAGDPDRVDPGDVINYTLTATNDGNLPLTAVEIHDVSLTLNCAPLQPAALAPGEALVCTGTHTLDQDDINAGRVDNSATAGGTDPNGDPVTDTDTANVPLAAVPHLTLVKEATLDMTQAGPPDRPDPGDVINYTLTATNDGNVQLTDVTISDATLTLNCAPTQPAVLAPGEQLVCTGTRILTHDDIGAGDVDNTATATGTDTNNNSVGDTDHVNVPLAQQPHLSLVKEASESIFNAAGDVLHYTFTVENTGNIPLAGPVSVTDDKSTNESCPDVSTVGDNDGNVDPGETIVCTATYTVTQTDVNAGSVTNNATAHADGTDSNSDQVIVPAVQGPELTLTKQAGEPSFSAVGDVLHYTFSVENTGNVSLAGPVTVTDDKATDESCPNLNTVGNNDGNLDPGETVVCTASYTVIQSDLDDGNVTNNATAHAAGTNSNADQVIVPASQTPHLTLVKEATLDITNGDPDRVDAGDVVHYTLTATNDGNVTLDGVSIVDDPPLPLNCAPAQPTALAPGAQLVCTGTRILDQGDVNSGHAIDLGSAEGTDPNGKTIGDTDNVDVPLGQEPHLTLVKEATLDITNGDPDRLDAGDVINYTLTATNDGNVTLTAVAQNDPTLTLNCVPPQPAILDPGETLVCTGTRILDQADIDAGHADNLASVEGTDTNGKTVRDEDNVDVPLAREPHITVTKEGTLDTTQAGDPDQVDPGDVINYTLTAANDGNVTLDAVEISDPSLPALNCTPPQPVSLAPGEQIVCTGTRVLDQDDIDAGHAANLAGVEGTDPSGNTVSDADNVDVPLGQTPHLTLDKVATLDMTPNGPANRANPGDVIGYTLTATNDGNVTLTGVAIDDPTLALDCTPSQPATLAPGETLVCTGTRDLTQADFNAGSADNVATAEGTDPAGKPVSDGATANVPLAQNPQLTLVKKATETEFDTAGDVLHYTFTIENTGNVSLGSPVTVTDDKASDESCPDLATVGNGDASLDPGETVDCTATYSVTQADLNAGSVTNLATAHAGGTDSNPDQVTVVAAQSPQIEIAKSSNINSTTTVGDTVTFTFVVTNTGNVTITSYSVTDPLPGLSAIDCSGQPSQLAPGGSATCHATYTITQADLDAGQLSNTASVDGQTQNAGPVTDSDQLTSPLQGLGTLQVVKRLVPADDGGRFDLRIDGVAKATGVGDGGQTPAVPASSTGDHSVSETAASGTELGDYTADTACTRNGNPIPNLDPAHVTVGLGDAVVCTITNNRKPTGLAIAKSAPATAHDGDTITYGIQVTNTGAVPLRNVTVNDAKCPGGLVLTGGDANLDGRLDTTEAWTYNCTYQVQHGDEDGTRHIVNVASASATNGSGHPVGPVEASASTLITHPAISMLKTAPATVPAGAPIPFRIAVTNSGDTSFAAADVKVTDPLCGSAPLPVLDKGGDTSPDSLDPGDTWIYRCVVQTKPGESGPVRNSASVQTVDGTGTTVTAGDNVETQLVEGEQSAGGGRAKLTGRTGCVYKPFMATVRGRQIAKVRFTLNGRVVKRVTNRKNATRIGYRVVPSRLRAGNQRFVARVTFTRASGTKAKTLRLSFRVCPKQVTSPQFTG